MQAKERDLTMSVEAIQRKAAEIIALEQQKIMQLSERLQSYDPRAILRRGYARIQNDNQKAIFSVNDISLGQRISLRLQDGTIDAQAEKITKMKGTI